MKILELTTPSKLILIDIDLKRLKEENEAILRRNERVEFIEGDSAEELFKLPKHSCDWIYIDACHDYDHVRRDIIAAADKVRVGGYLIFNDYTSWSPANMMNYGVSRAVNEFLNENPNWLVSSFALSPGGYHDIALCLGEPLHEQ
jgi:cephalosporin hydroxylase